MHRFFADEKQADELVLSQPEDVHHAVKVLRLRPGEAVEVVYQGALYQSKVTALAQTVRFGNLTPVPAPADQAALSLIQGFPKGSKINDILMHGTECGINHFILTQMERSVAKLDEKRLERYQRIVKDAARQSKQLALPTIQFQNLGEIDFSVYDTVYFFYEDTTAPLSVAPDDDSIAVIIGPEGGFSPAEVDFLNRLPNVRQVSLGPRIYRTETAGLIACAIIRHRLENK